MRLALNPRNVKLGLMNPHLGLSVGSILFRSNLNGFGDFTSGGDGSPQGVLHF